MNSIQKKRIYFYLPILITVLLLLFLDGLIYRSIVALIILVYTGFIVFLRDSIQIEEPSILTEPSKIPDDFRKSEYIERADNVNEENEVVGEEGFTIISGTADVEIQSGFRGTSRRVGTLKPLDLKERFNEIVNESLPQGVDQSGQFVFVLEKMLMVIKEVYNAHSAIFFWYDKGKEKLAIETFISDSKDISKRKFDIENDILSSIVKNEEPDFLNDLQSIAEVDSIRYYSVPQGIKSFAGIPVFYNKKLIAIIAVDAKDSDVFGIETVYSLGRFARIITMLISIFEDQHNDSTTQQRLKSLLNIITPERRFDTEDDLIKSVLAIANDLMQFDAFAFVYFNPIEQKFKTQKIVNNTSLKYVGEHLEIELNGSLVGKAILSGMPIKVDDTSSKEVIRFAKVEDVSFDGSFLAIPIVYNAQNFGVMCFESLKKNAFSANDVSFMKNSSAIIAFIIYSFSTQKLLKNLMAVDYETRLLNNHSFKSHVEADLQKIKDVKLPAAIALIKIDDFLEQESLFENNPFPKVLTTVADLIKVEVPPTGVLGRIGERTFGVFFFNMTSKDAFMWGERLRKNIARTPISVVSKQTTYTVSVGIASATNSDYEEVLYNAELALKKALERGGNLVKNIN